MRIRFLLLSSLFFKNGKIINFWFHIYVAECTEFFFTVFPLFFNSHSFFVCSISSSTFTNGPSGRADRPWTALCVTLNGPLCLTYSLFVLELLTVCRLASWPSVAWPPDRLRRPPEPVLHFKIAREFASSIFFYPYVFVMVILFV